MSTSETTRSAGHPEANEGGHLKGLSETAWQARMMALPRVIWREGCYRIVLWYDEEADEICRTPERLCGCDLLGQERWETLDAERTWNDERGELAVSAHWQYLAHQLAVTAAPWPQVSTEPTAPAGD